jgi:hypothetical protein
VLDGASRDDIRQRFVRWREGRIVTRPGNPFPLPSDPSLILPRFTYCLYVDHECLATLGPHLAAKPSDISRPHHPPPPLVAIIIDGNYEPQQDAQGPYPPVDGSTARYLGWEYFDTRYICALYDDLHASDLDCADYRRPPAIAPRGSPSMQSVKVAFALIYSGTLHMLLSHSGTPSLCLATQKFARVKFGNLGICNYLRDFGSAIYFNNCPHFHLCLRWINSM